MRKKKKAPTESCIIKTRGCIDDMVLALCKSANDSSVRVKNTVNSSLLDIGRKQPNLVMSTCTQFLRTNKLNTPHRVKLLKVMKKVLELHRSNMNEKLLEPMSELLLSDMTREKKVVADWQGSASAVLVSLGLRWPHVIMDKLMERFSPGQVPHYFVIFTLGDLAVAHPLAIVPRLKNVLARVIPILGSVKQDNMKWVFASGMFKFCDAIVSYVVNKQGAKDKDDLTATSFSGEIYPAYEIMFSTWIKSNQAKVRAVTIQAVGSMCAIMTPTQFETELPKILAGVLMLYKKDKDHYPVTIGLSVILNVAVKDGNRVLERHLNTLFLSLHNLTCRPPDPNIAQSLDNYNELLRCFDIIGKVFCDEVLHFLLERLDARLSKTAQQRVGTLQIIKHIVTRLTEPEVIDDKKGLVVNGLKPLLTSETDVYVKMTAAQLIVCMAGHDYLAYEGGEVLVEFIVRQASITEADIKLYEAQKKKSKKPIDDLKHSPKELRGMADNILTICATTIDCMEDVLWPYLLETIVPKEFIGAAAIVSKGIAFLGNKKRQEEEEDYLFDFDEFVNVPKPPELVVRFLVLLSYPLRRGNLGLHVLRALHAIGPVLDPAIGDMWDNTIPKLAGFLQNKSKDKSQWDNNSWEELVLRLLSETIKVVDDDSWTTQAAEALCTHFDSYQGDSELRKSCLKHLGLLLQKLSKKDFLRNTLDLMYTKLNHDDPLERQGCAQGYGYCSASHLDMVLDKINAEATGKGTGVPEPKKRGLFGFLSGGGSKGPTQGQLNTIMLCYGYVAAYSSPSLITTRIDVSVLTNMKTHLQNPKGSDTLKESMITSIDLIGKAMHPNHLGGAYKLKQRDELVKYLLDFMIPKKKGTVGHAVRVLGLNALATLINLQPPLPIELEAQVLERIMTMYHVGVVPEKKKKGADTGEKEKKQIDEMQENLNVVLLAILQMDLSISCLQRIFSFVERYIVHGSPLVRERSCQSILRLLKKYVEEKTQQLNEIMDDDDDEDEDDEDEEAAEAARRKRKKEKMKKLQDVQFDKIGYYLSMIIPRCTDSAKEDIRTTAIETVGLMLYIDHILRANMVVEGEDLQEKELDFAPPDSLRPINALRDRIRAAEINQQYAVVQELSGVIASVITLEELLRFLKRIMIALTDVELSGACGACVVLNGIIKRRGEELADKVTEVVSELLTEMQKIKSEQTLNATLHAVRNLALHHREAVIETLLEQPLPHAPEVVKSFQVLAKDAELVKDLVLQLTNIMNNKLLMKEKAKNKFQALPIPMAATAALGEIMETREMQTVVQDHYSLFAGTILLRFGTSHGMQNAMKITTECFKKFLKCAKETELEKDFDYAKLVAPDYHRAITIITAGFAKSHPDQKQGIYTFLVPYLKGNYNGQRVVSAAAIAELINHAKDPALLKDLLNAMMLNMTDPVVKLQCLIGLGNIASAGKTEVDKYATTVLGALLATIDGDDHVLAMESMNGLSKVFEVVDESQVAPSLINLCLRIQPAFEKPTDDMRAAAFVLFGTMSRFGSHSMAAQVFLEQVHKTMPCLIMHANDPNDDVKEACKRALRRFSPLLGNAELEKYLTSDVTAEGSKLDYDEFLDAVGKLLISAFPDRMNYYIMTTIEYFKSNWTQLRGNATTLVGFVLHHLPQERRGFLNIPMITQALISLLREKDADVRRRCAAAMGLLYEY